MQDYTRYDPTTGLITSRGKMNAEDFALLVYEGRPLLVGHLPAEVTHIDLQTKQPKTPAPRPTPATNPADPPLTRDGMTPHNPAPPVLLDQMEFWPPKPVKPIVPDPEQPKAPHDPIRPEPANPEPRAPGPRDIPRA